MNLNRKVAGYAEYGTPQYHIKADGDARFHAEQWRGDRYLMSTALLAFIFVAGLAAAQFFVARGYVQSEAREAGIRARSPLSSYGAAGSLVFGGFAALLTGVSALSGLSDYFGTETTIAGELTVAFLLSLGVVFAVFSPDARAHRWTESAARIALFCLTAVSVAFTALIFIVLAYKTAEFFEFTPPLAFLTGTRWEPQLMQTDSHAFGFLPLALGTALITLIAICTASIPGLLSGIYLAEIASAKAKRRLKPVLEVLSGVPTVIYGYAAAAYAGPGLSRFAEQFGVAMAPESALAAGLTIGVMITPVIIAMTDDALSAAPQSLREASYGIGATRAETALLVMLPAAAPGVAAGFLLALSRAAGETMIVVMAAGLSANLTINPLEPVTTVTVQIVQMLTGDQDFHDPKTLSAFALGLTLFTLTWVFNYAALKITKRKRY